ncbi:MAG: TetR/AcrR family transcriptional regulator [Polyangiaceae bacterium]|nr:TetR/AcrR family transcriptional regulator [Polyangiaceae bacterium]
MKRVQRPRRRLDAETAREVILDAAEARLVAVGPSGLRLQEVARTAGVSHPTVLHHFGSREGLVHAVASRAVRSMNAALVDAIAGSEGDEERLQAILARTGEALDSGHARVVLWLALEGRVVDDAGSGLREVVDATHALRLARVPAGAEAPTREDTARTVVLAALALVAGAVVGPTLLERAGLSGGARSAAGFRRWLGRLLLGHLDASG